MTTGRAQTTTAIPVLTGAGFLALASVVIVPLIALFEDWPEERAYLVLLFCFGIFTVIMFLELLQVIRLKNSLRIKTSIDERIYLGNSSALKIRARTKRPLSHTIFYLRPELPLGVIPVYEQIKATLAANASQFEAAYTFTPLNRGTIIWPRIFLRVQFSSRLFAWQFSYPLLDSNKSLVYPNPFSSDIDNNPLLRSLKIGLTPNDFNGGEGREFDRLRPYSHGDEVRNIDWKRSARRMRSQPGGSWVVRVYRPETHQRIQLLLDCSRHMGNAVENRLQLDFAIDASAALSRIAITNNDEVGLYAFSHRQEANLHCRRGERQHAMIMDTLLPLRPSQLEPDLRLVERTTLNTRRRTLFALITSASSLQSLEEVRLSLLPVARKHLPLVLVVADRDLHKLAYSAAPTVEKAYVVSAAHEHLQGLTRQVGILQRSGIHCIYCDVKDLGKNLVKKYIELKLQGKL